MATKMSKANSRFSTDTLRRLGEELNSTLERCIPEPGRNVYDVDATESLVTLNNAEVVEVSLRWRHNLQSNDV